MTVIISTVAMVTVDFRGPPLTLSTRVRTTPVITGTPLLLTRAGAIQLLTMGTNMTRIVVRIFGTVSGRAMC